MNVRYNVFKVVTVGISSPRKSSTKSRRALHNMMSEVKGPEKGQEDSPRTYEESLPLFEFCELAAVPRMLRMLELVVW